MDTSRLKKFAVEARDNLVKGVFDRLKSLGFDENGQVAESDHPVEMEGGSIFRGEIKSGDGFFKKWTALESAIKNHPHGAKVGFRQVAEAAAYTWFNRFVAIRILQKNKLIEPQLAYAEGGRIPLIVENARQGRLPKLDETERAELNTLLDDDSKVLEQFALLIVAYCHTMPILLECFGHIDDYTELLLPNNILVAGGFVDLLNNTDYITEEDFKQTELIGWLYQFYISEKKDEVFASFKNKKKAEAEDIPAATQIFTPNWIVKYMVQNTLGRIYLDNNPGSSLANEWKYLVKDAERVEAAIYKYIDLEHLKVADFACGSGHILDEFFDMLYAFYMEEAYSSAEAIEHIFRDNIIGIDLDTRAKQLSMFSLLLKACQKNAKFVDAKVLPRVYDMPDVEPNGYTWKEVGGHFCCRFDFEAPEKLNKELLEAFTLLGSARNLGSTMKFNVGNATREYMQRCLQYHDEHPEVFGRNEADFAPIFESFELILALTDKYSAVVMNPPYMQSSNMNAELADYLKDCYPDSKIDLYSVFMEVALNAIDLNAKYGMINMHSWMFLRSFKNLRKKILENCHISSMIHLGTRIFDELNGEVVQNTAYIITNEQGKECQGTYFRLVNGINSSDKEKMFLDALDKNDEVEIPFAKRVLYKNISQKNFSKMPGSPFGYWATQRVLECFKGSNVSSLYEASNCIQPGNAELFLRYWNEIDKNKVNNSWKFVSKGGSYRKWYGNIEYTLNYGVNGEPLLRHPKTTLRTPEKYFQKGFVWSRITTGPISARFWSEEKLVTDAGPILYCDDLYFLGLLNSCPSAYFLLLISPTINYQVGNIENIPVKNIANDAIIRENVSKNISISKYDWDAHETSWDFAVNEIVDLDSEDKFMNTVGEINELTGGQQTFDIPDFGSIEERLRLVKSRWRARFEKLHENEEELNRQFIEIYGLEDELTPDVPLDEVTILQQGEISIEEDG